MKKFFSILIFVLCLQVVDAQNYALDFSGGNKYVSCGAGESLKIQNQISFEAWVYPLTVPINKSGVLSYMHDNLNDESGFGFLWYNSRMRAYIKTTNMAANAWQNNAGITIPTGKWSHIAGTYDGSSVKFYLNGVLKSTTIATGTISWNFQPEDFRIGVFHDSDENFYFDGYIDEVRVWNTALSAETIFNWQKRYVNDIHPNSQNLVSYWKLDDNNGLTAADAKNMNNGTVVDATSFENTNSAFSLTDKGVTAVCSQNIEEVLPATIVNQVLTLKITTEDVSKPLMLNQLKIDLSGTTNLTDIKNIRVFSTGASPVFSPVKPIFSMNLEAAQTVTFSNELGGMPLYKGDNYFWICCDVNLEAGIENAVDMACESFTINNIEIVPANQNPAGKRYIVQKISQILEFEFDTDIEISPNWTPSANTTLLLTNRDMSGKWLTINGNGMTGAGTAVYSFNHPIDLLATPYIRLMAETTKKALDFQIYIEDDDGSRTDVSKFLAYLDPNHTVELFADFSTRTASNTGYLDPISGKRTVNLSSISKIGFVWTSGQNLNGNLYLDNIRIGKKAIRSTITEHKYLSNSGLVPAHWNAPRGNSTLSMTTNGELCFDAFLNVEQQGIKIYLIDTLNLTDNHYLRFIARSNQTDDAVSLRFTDYNNVSVDWVNLSLHQFNTEIAIDLNEVFAQNPSFNKSKISVIQIFPHHYEPFTGKIYFTEFKISADAIQKTYTSYSQNFDSETVPPFWVSNDYHTIETQSNSLSVEVNKLDEIHSLKMSFADVYDLKNYPYIKLNISAIPSIEYTQLDNFVVLLKDANGMYNDYPADIISYPVGSHTTELFFDFRNKLRNESANLIDIQKITGLKILFGKDVMWKGMVTIDNFRMGEAAAPQTVNTYTENFDSDALPPFWVSNREIDMANIQTSENGILSMNIHTISQNDFNTISFSDYIDLQQYPYISFDASASSVIQHFSLSVFDKNDIGVEAISTALDNQIRNYVFDIEELNIVELAQIRYLRLYPDKSAPFLGSICLDNFTMGKAAMNDSLAVLRAAKLLKITHKTIEYDNSVFIPSDSDLGLPTGLPDDVSITWQSSNLQYITSNGKLTQSTYLEGDITVTLTASLQKGNKLFTKQFQCNVLHKPITDAEKVIVAYRSISQPLILTEDVDFNVLTKVSNIVNNIELIAPLTVNVVASQIGNVAENGDITYQYKNTGEVWFRFSVNSESQIFTVNVSLPEAKKFSLTNVIPLLPTKLNPVETIDINVVTMLQTIANGLAPNITVSLKNSTHPNINSEGQITYWATNSHSVEFYLSKDGMQQSVEILVDVPLGNGKMVENAETVIPDIYNTEEGVDYNFITSLEALINSASNGVKINIVNCENANIQSDGTIIYNFAASGEISIRLTKQNAEKIVKLTVNVPLSNDQKLLQKVINALPLNLKPTEGVDNNILTLLNTYIQPISTTVNAVIQSVTKPENIALNGGITYSQAMECTIVFSLSKGIAKQDVSIIALLPQSHTLKVLAEVAGSFPQVVVVQEGVHSNLISLLTAFAQVIDNEVYLQIGSAANQHPNILTDGTLVYGESAVSQTVSIIITKGNTSSTIDVLVQIPASKTNALYNYTINNQLIAYPNPTKGELHFDGITADYALISNANGVVMGIYWLVNQTIDISSLSNGAYFVSLYSKNRIINTFSIVKK